jgi:IclR family acetate operon transcriptional repressor
VTTRRRPGTPTSVIARVALVLDAVNAGGALAVTDIARATGLPKATVSRLVIELLDHEFLAHEEHLVRSGRRITRPLDDSPVPGTRPATEAPKTSPPPAAATVINALSRLRLVTGRAVHFAVLDRGVARSRAVLPHRGHPTPVAPGQALPAHATAVGKAMLAWAEAAVLKTVIDAGLTTPGPRAITDPQRLREELSRVRALGIAREHNESGPSVACLAAPVRLDDGGVVAGISVICSRPDAGLRRSEAAVRSTALTLGRSLSRVPARNHGEDRD